MEVIKTNINGVLLVKPDVYKDERGFFMETFSQKKYIAHGIEATFLQDNYSHSKKNTIRGLHYQLEHPQGKLVRVVSGSVQDFAVDIRIDSPTFGEHFMVELNDKEHLQLYMPPGIAHGFFVNSDSVDFEYKCTDYYYPDDQYGVLFSDPELGLGIPLDDIVTSKQDKEFLPLNKIKLEFLPTLDLDI